MRRDSTTYSANQSNHPTPESVSPPVLRRREVPIRALLELIAAMAGGALLLALTYQVPVTHTVDVGGYDSAYVQGFYDPERALPGQQRLDLEGSDGSARWTRDQSFLIFPQAGLPAQVTLRLRGWRPSGPAPQVIVLLNGARELGRFQASANWQDYTFTLDGGLLKPNDVVIEIRSETAQIDAADSRRVGVLLDRASFHAGPAPIMPYPPQLLYGALAAGMLYILFRQPTTDDRRPTTDDRRPTTDDGRARLWSVVSGRWSYAGCLLVVALAFLLLYRAQPLYPYPLLRLLPAIDAALAALLALRYGAALAARVPILLDLLALGGLGAWTAVVLAASQRHLTLSVPSAENDFRVFALRSAHLAGSFPGGTANPDLDGVFRADGFYNLGYPLLLWLARPFTQDNPFLAARLVAALGGALLLGAGWWLARRLLGRGPALLALLMLALSPLVVEGALYVGTDMPFAALCTLAIALLMPIADCRWQKADQSERQSTIYHLQSAIVIAAGVAAGATFLVRHPGMLLLPLGWLVLWQTETSPINSKLKTQNVKLMLLFTVAFVLTITPQLYANIRDTGAPLYSQQAKNVWQAVFGDGDWGRWGEATNSIGLSQVIAQDPARFLANWWANLRGFIGTGGEDTREFGQAAQLRLLGFPANWLAVAGLLGWLVSVGKRQKAKGKTEERNTYTFYLLPFTLLLIWIIVYVVAISVGLPLQGRFLLPLVPVYAIAAAWLIAQLKQLMVQHLNPDTTHYGLHITHYALRITHYASRTPALLAGLVLVAFLWGGFATGADYVLRVQPDANTPGQPADALGAARLIQAALGPGDRVVLRVAPDDKPGQALGKYSAIAHLVLPTPAGDDPQALRATGARYLLWSSALGPAPQFGEQIGAAGIYTLLRST